MADSIVPDILVLKLEFLRDFAARGRRILPTHWVGENTCSCNREICRAWGKHPLISEWQHNASADPEQVRDWHEWWPYANWAWVQDLTFTVDVDTKRGGLESLRNWENDTGGPPGTLTQRTASGGLHYVYRQPEDSPIPQGGDFLPGIEVRGVGSYIMIEPSLGVAGGWVFEPGETEPQDCDPWTLELIRERSIGTATYATDGTRREDPNHTSDLPGTAVFIREGFGCHSGSRNRDAYCLTWRLLALQQFHPERYTTEFITGLMRQIWRVTPQEPHPFPWEEVRYCMSSAWRRRQAQEAQKQSETRQLLGRWLGGEA